jgi:5-methylcytosine-specific restriction endonuclease McrA
MLIRIEHKLGVLAVDGSGHNTIFKCGDVVEWEPDADAQALVSQGYASAVTGPAPAKQHVGPNGMAGHWRALWGGGRMIPLLIAGVALLLLGVLVVLGGHDPIVDPRRRQRRQHQRVMDLATGKGRLWQPGDVEDWPMPRRAEPHRPAHAKGRKVYDRAYDEARAADHKFYCSAAWRKFRAWFLSDPANVMCARCHRNEANEVNHKQRRRDRPDLAFDPDNCEALCKSCHSKHTNAHDGGLGHKPTDASEDVSDGQRG